jgi:hypothetical protein
MFEKEAARFSMCSWWSRVSDLRQSLATLASVDHISARSPSSLLRGWSQIKLVAKEVCPIKQSQSMTVTASST